MVLSMKLFLHTLLLIFFSPTADAEGKSEAKAVYAVNCGGGKHFDQFLKVTYQQDRGFSAGTGSDYGSTYPKMDRVKDDTVYRTERYHTGNFNYKIPVRGQGQHTLVLKFSEVYFSSPNQKVFDVAVGGLPVIRNLDIFKTVGKAVPHDEYVELTVEGDKLYVEGTEVSKGWDPQNKMVTVDFLRGKKDNPKVNAIVLYEGSYVERLPPPRRTAARATGEMRDEMSEVEEDDDAGEEYEDTMETETSYESNQEQDDIWGKEETPSALTTFVSSTTGLVTMGGVIAVTCYIVFTMMSSKSTPVGPSKSQQSSKKSK